jgi:alpha/beta superfamily hydrolase
MATRLTLTTVDGERIEAEEALPLGGRRPRAGIVLCHPHPLYGGSMETIVPATLFSALPTMAVTAVRFNFRGVGASTGSHTGGDAEVHDVQAALEHLATIVPAGTPIIMQGWSFGAVMALSLTDDRIAAWFGVAPPLQHGIGPGTAAAGADPRRKVVAIGRQDRVCGPAVLEPILETWVNTRAETIEGADHFFAGQTRRLVELADELVEELAV